jgi:ATP-dependent Zn protease
MHSLAVVLTNCDVFPLGAMKNDPQLAAQRLAATAYHEAGHAVMALSLGRPIQKVTISPTQLQTGGMRLGVCEIKKGRLKASKDAREDEVLILLAGMVAEARFSGQYCQLGAAGDLRSVRRLLESRTSNERQFKRLQQRLLDKTEHQLRDQGHAQAVALIADQLVEKTTISGRAARHFFDQALKQFC